MKKAEGKGGKACGILVSERVYSSGIHRGGYGNDIPNTNSQISQYSLLILKYATVVDMAP